MRHKKDPLDKALPANIDSEKFLLGSVLISGGRWAEMAGTVKISDFSLESHRRIYHRMSELYERHEEINRTTVANELMRFGELESIGGLKYIVDLDTGMPVVADLSSFCNIVIDKSLLRQVALQSQNLLNRAMTGEESPHDLIATGGDALLRLSASRTLTDFSSPESIIANYDGGINSFLDPSKKSLGIKTGFLELDAMTGGLYPGNVCLIAGRPSQGKTALALNIATRIALKLGLPVAIFSLEMSRESLLSRMACAQAKVDSQRFRLGMLDEDERLKLRIAIRELTESKLFIDDTSQINLASMRAKLTRLQQAEGKIGLVVVDYIQLMEGTSGGENRNQELGRISRGLKVLSKDFGCPFIVLSQLSRETEKKGRDGRPQLSDLRDSGSLESDADWVGFVYREELYRPDREDLRGVAELILAKQREGPIGIVHLTFLHKYTRFENREMDGSQN